MKCFLNYLTEPETSIPLIKRSEKVVMMTRSILTMFTLLIVSAFALNSASDQFTGKIAKLKAAKPEKAQANTNDSPSTEKLNSKTSDAKHIYENQRPTDVPVLLKNSIYVQAKTHDEYWKMPGQRNFSS